MEELKKPFAVARMSFSPDYNDPLIKQMMLQQCMQSVGNLFGNVQPVMQTISIPRSADAEEDIDLPADPISEDSGQQETYQQTPPAQDQQSTPSMQEQPENRAQDFCCDKCGTVIPERVWNYSYENFERPLCYKCQKIVRNEQKRGHR